MKKLICLIAIIGIMAIGTLAIAQDDGIILKQHSLLTWEKGEYKNASTATVVKTSPIETAPKWVNAIIDGWSLEAGPAYEDETIKDGALLASREFGTLGKYIPWLIFPFKDKLTITLDVAGLYFEDITNQIKTEGVSGIGYLKGTIKF